MVAFSLGVKKAAGRGLVGVHARQARISSYAAGAAV